MAYDRRTTESLQWVARFVSILTQGVQWTGKQYERSEDFLRDQAIRMLQDPHYLSEYLAEEHDDG